MAAKIASMRWELGISAVAVLALAACSTAPRPTGNPDPGHQRMNLIKPVWSTIPRDAAISLERSSEPKWDSCDGVKSTYGWNPVTVDAEFTASESPARLVEAIDGSLRAMGWKPDRSVSFGGGAWHWSKPIPDGMTASIQLLGGPCVEPDGWSLDVSAPPATHPSRGC